MSEQTAVEFLYDQIWKTPISKWHELLDQAKAIEEKNLKDSFVVGASMGEMFNNENRCYISDAEKYLKETFKSE